jgi:putative endonuclease
MFVLDPIGCWYVYIMASRRHGTLYTGMTDHLVRRVWQHKAKVRTGFTTTYRVDKLVWAEGHAFKVEAFIRERRIKEWKRRWKIELIEALNPAWLDLAESEQFTSAYPDIAAEWRATHGSRLSPG